MEVDMKIRAGFVTNSSSYTSADITIDDPLLLEILQKYKDLGAFGDEYFGGYNFSIGYLDPEAGTIAFHYDVNESAHDAIPSDIGRLLDEIVNLINYDIDNNIIYDTELLELMATELNEKKTAIIESIEKINWHVQEDRMVAKKDWYFRCQKGGKDCEYKEDLDEYGGEWPENY
jgi:hypothetical protein